MNDVTPTRQLCVFTKYFPEAPTTFAWLTHPGVYYGNLAYGNQRPGDQVCAFRDTVKGEAQDGRW